MGDYVGEEAFFQTSGGVRVNRKTVMSCTRMVVCVLHFHTLERMMTVRPDLAVDLLMHVAAQLVQRSLQNCAVDLQVTEP